MSSISRSTAFLLLSLSFTLACGPTRFYTGPARGDEEVAIINADSQTLILAIGGWEQRSRSAAVLPGVYDIEFVYILKGKEMHSAFEEGQQFKEYCTLRLRAEAGHRYTVSRGKLRKGGAKEQIALISQDIGYDRSFLDETTQTDYSDQLRCS